jgi:hypothetical protein
MSKPSAPAPPNPVDTARASTSTNVGTAITNAFLNNTNQYTPDGSLRYDVTGSHQWNDPYTGMTVDIPTFSATQQLSPQQQAIKSQTDAAKYNMAGMANMQSDRLAKHLGQNLDLSGAPAAGDPNAITGVPKALTEFGASDPITKSYGEGDFNVSRDKYEDALMQRMNPQLSRERGNIEQRLSDQGIRYGRQAYSSAMDDYNRQANDARFAAVGAAGQEQARMMQMAQQRAAFENQAQGQGFQQEALRGQFTNAGLAQQLQQGQAGFNAANTARGQYMTEQYAARNQPIQEISALLSGSQIQNPNFHQTPTNQIPTTDVAGLVNTRFNQDLDIYKQESQSYNALMGGILGMAGGMMKMGMSDRREKEDIVRVGTVFATDVDENEPAKLKNADGDGSKKELPIYEYAFKRDPDKTRHVGPMAQDVEKFDRGAVKTKGGIKYIDRERVMGNILRVA